MADYIKRIVYFIVLQTVGEMIFPEKFKGYLRLVMSLTAVMIIISPFKAGSLEKWSFSLEADNDIYKKSNEIISEQYNSIIENRFKDKGLKSAETKMGSYKIESIEIEGDFENEEEIREDISKNIGIYKQQIHINGR